MKQLTFLILLSTLSSYTLASMKCERELSLQQATASVEQFVHEKRLFNFKDMDISFKRSNKTCHYYYVIHDKSDYSKKFPRESAYTILLNDRGQVVKSDPEPAIKTSCPNMNLTVNFFKEKLRALRANNDLPIEPEKYKVFLDTYISCEYEYIEYKDSLEDKPGFILPAGRINTFKFDFNGDLYSYN